MQGANSYSLRLDGRGQRKSEFTRQLPGSFLAIFKLSVDRFSAEARGGPILGDVMEITEYLTPEEVASILKVFTDFIIRRFGRGVIDLGAPETRFKRGYRVLRILKSAIGSS